MADLFSKFVFSLFLFVILPVFISAQSKSCNLQFSVYEFKDDGSSEQFPIKDSKVKMVDKKTKKSLKISDSNGLVLISNAPVGDYEIAFSKAGFQTTLNQYSVDCSSVNPQNLIEEIMFLWKGDSKQTKKYWDDSFNGEVSAYRGDKTIVGDKGVGTSNKEVSDASKIDNSTIVNGRAVNLVKPVYPKAALAVRARGTVEVQVTINELGYVVSAEAVSGHALLRGAAVAAAKNSKFSMTLLEGLPVKVTGVIVYNFTAQ